MNAQPKRTLEDNLVAAQKFGARRKYFIKGKLKYSELRLIFPGIIDWKILSSLVGFGSFEINLKASVPTVPSKATPTRSINPRKTEIGIINRTFLLSLTSRREKAFLMRSTNFCNFPLSIIELRFEG